MLKFPKRKILNNDCELNIQYLISILSKSFIHIIGKTWEYP
jgi:hypothetical protein